MSVDRIPASAGSQTLAIHAGEQPDPVTGASSPNLVMSTTFETDPDVSFSAEDFGEAFTPELREQEERMRRQSAAGS